MSIRNRLPAIGMGTRPGLRSELSPQVVARWNAGLRAAGDEPDGVTISVLGAIGEDYWGEGVTAKLVAAILRRANGAAVTVNVNSPGGDFFEGVAVYNLLREHPGHVTVNVLGLAASAAAVIAMAGDEVRIARAGFLMIHNTWVVAAGDRVGLRAVADWLEPFDAAEADLFATRTGLPRDEVAAMLDRETWIGGSEAVEKGFADALLPSDQIASDMADGGEGRAAALFHRLDALLARGGAIPRSERRELLKDLKTGTPGAAQDRTPGAAVIAEGIADLLSLARTI